MDNRNDDGSLAFLEIAPDEANKHFNCPETTQQQLINRSFWLCDFIKGVKTKHADDLVFFSSSKQLLRELLAAIEGRLGSKLKLEIKPNKQIFPVARSHRDKHGRGVDFLGYVFYLEETRLRKGIKKNFARAIANMRKAKKPISEADFLQRCASWWGWCKHSDSKHLINKLNQTAPYEIKFKR